MKSVSYSIRPFFLEERTNIPWIIVASASDCQMRSARCNIGKVLEKMEAVIWGIALLGVWERTSCSGREIDRARGGK